MASPDHSRNVLTPEEFKRIQFDAATWEGVAVRRIPDLGLGTETVRHALDELTTRHHLEGVALASPPTIFVNGSQEFCDGLRLASPLFLPYGWPGTFGCSLTLTLGIPNVSGARAVVPHGSPFLETLKDGRFRAAVVAGSKIVAAYEVDLNASPDAFRLLQEHIRTVQEGKPPSSPLRAALHYWEILDCQGKRWLRGEDKLSLSWYRFYSEEIRGLHLWLDDIRKEQPLPALPDVAPPSLCAYADAIKRCNYDGDRVLETLLPDFKRCPRDLAILDDWARPPGYDWDNFEQLCRGIFQCLFNGAEATQCGRRLSWLHPVRGTCESLDLTPDEFPESADPELFWQHVLRDLRFGWGFCFSSCDFPIRPLSLIDSRDEFPRTDDSETAAASTTALFDEATAMKRATIPPRALVDLALGPFVETRIQELPRGNVLIALRNGDGHAMLVIVEPAARYCSFSLPPSDALSTEDARSIEAATHLLIAAVIRDFWVVDERDRVFSVRTERGTRVSREDSDEPRIVYVPRIRYRDAPDVKRCQTELSQQERCTHLVRAHLRKSPAASDTQLAMAARYGFALPEGFTFVRPHMRGKQKREILYRSRSALQSLYTKLEAGEASAGSRWFQFEKDVMGLMVSLGFDVQHVSTSGRGDNGIDVFATKGGDFDCVNWVIQCKCWNPKRKVYPSTVRELIGVMAAFPQGTQGMIVTTSTFSAGARTTADGAAIRLTDGAEFRSLVIQTGPIQ